MLCYRIPLHTTPHARYVSCYTIVYYCIQRPRSLHVMLYNSILLHTTPTPAHVMLYNNIPLHTTPCARYMSCYAIVYYCIQRPTPLPIRYTIVYDCIQRHTPILRQLCNSKPLHTITTPRYTIVYNRIRLYPFFSRLIIFLIKYKFKQLIIIFHYRSFFDLQIQNDFFPLYDEKACLTGRPTLKLFFDLIPIIYLFIINFN